MAVVDEERTYLLSLIFDVAHFRNIQLDLLLVATALLALWGVLRPDHLRRPWPWLAAGMVLLLVAASPVRVFVNALVVPPYTNPQVMSRTVAGPLTASFIVLIWLYACGRLAGWRALGIVGEPRPARRLVILAGAMVVAMMPWHILLTVLYSRYLEVVRTTIRAQSGPIPIEDTIFESHPRLNHDDFAPEALSLIMRTSPTDGVMILTDRKPADRMVDPAAPRDLGRFIWRD